MMDMRAFTSHDARSAPRPLPETPPALCNRANRCFERGQRSPDDKIVKRRTVLILSKWDDYSKKKTGAFLQQMPGFSMRCLGTVAMKASHRNRHVKRPEIKHFLVRHGFIRIRAPSSRFKALRNMILPILPGRRIYSAPDSAGGG
jgi:hypothetical protein